MSKFKFNKQELIELYINQNIRRKDVAKIYGCSDVLIKKTLQKFGIKKPKELEWKNKERKVIKQCLNCNKDFEVNKYHATGDREIKFCSHLCSAQFRDLGPEHRTKMRNIRGARRRANMAKATVPLSSKEKQQIMEIYKNCPTGYEVDHIIPISKGGKHHPSNLQYLTAEENRSKSNKII